MVRHNTQVIIIDDSNQPKCEAGCGVDWTSPEMLALASQRIIARFGDKIHLKHINLSQATASQDATEWNEVIKDKSLSLPLLLIDGQPRISGQFDIRQLLDAIEAEMEMVGQ